jgi:hypothetical protein
LRCGFSPVPARSSERQEFHVPASASRITRSLLLAAVLVAAISAHAQKAASTQLAPGFTTRPAASKLVIVPADMELFSISAGGVVEPRADWTDAAQKNFALALAGERQRLGANVTTMSEAEADEFAEITTLQSAVAEAISLHHRDLKLAT